MPIIPSKFSARHTSVLGIGLAFALLSACTTPMVPAAITPKADVPAPRAEAPEASSPRRAGLLAIGLKPLSANEAQGYMNRCAGEIDDVLKGSGVTMTRKGRDLIITLPGDESFASGQSGIEAGVLPLLDNLAGVLKRCDQSYIDILGHADASGRKDVNDQLSEARARSTAGYLVDKAVAYQRLSVAGVGSAYPIASNAESQGRALNRRVEIVIRPLL